MIVETLLDLKKYLKVKEYVKEKNKAGQLILILEREDDARNKTYFSEKIDDIEEFKYDDIVKVIKKQPKARYLKRGDVISFARNYRNQDVLGIFDGTRIIKLYRNLDDYGSVPKEFVVFQPFVPDYWHDIIDHNDYVWVDLSKNMDEIMENWVFDRPVSHSRYTMNIKEKTKKCLLEIFWINHEDHDEKEWLDALQKKLTRSQPVFAGLTIGNSSFWDNYACDNRNFIPSDDADYVLDIDLMLGNNPYDIEDPY